MELRQLRSVEAVARHRHFTRAAEELHVAQSALSHQIRKLEQELGTPLFERTSRRVIPTEAGDAIAARARRVLAELDAARAEVDELRGVLRGRIWIGALLPAGDLDVPGLLARFSRAYPGVEVGLREGVAADMLGFLATDELDAAFCLLQGDVPEQLEAERLSDEEVVAVFALDRAPRARRVSVADLAERAIVATRRGSAITSALEERLGHPLRLALESGDPFLLRALAAQGFATAILPRSLTRLAGPAVEVRSLAPPLVLPVALVWRRRTASPAARTFVEFVRRETERRRPVS
ncbi:MAG TPA: LysR family transcriptional regulator [Solirubrobacteraceae bacterium]|nr:LysR family transcriptional regulator [Solirubrobacteraceae bacterium]